MPGKVPSPTPLRVFATEAVTECFLFCLALLFSMRDGKQVSGAKQPTLKIVT